MADAEAASKAVLNPTPIIDGRKANVNLAYLGAKPRPKSKTFSFYAKLIMSLYLFSVLTFC